MSEIKLDAKTAALLSGAEAGARLVGPDGKLVAGLLPPELITAFQLWVEKRNQLDSDDDEHVSLEELRAIEASGTAIPHEEVMKRLGFA
jgi:hypothetical protein